MSEQATALDNFSYLQNRELSWLEFNKRVLDQGADSHVPLFDRLSFVSIFWSNLQEFFMIRVGSLTDLSLVKKAIIDSKSGMTPAEQLTAIYERCHELNPYYEQCYKNLRKEFAKSGILNTRGKELTEPQLSYIEDYFYANIMPFLSPSIVNARHPFPHLENGAIYVIVRLDEEASKAAKKKAKAEAAERGDKGVSAKVDKAPGTKDGKGKSAKNLGADGVTLGIIPLPRQCNRVIRIPGEGMQFILLEHLIEMFVDKVYSMYKVKHTNVICVTRNADLDAAEGAEEQGDDYREHIKRILKKRMRLVPVRLESERELSTTVKSVLLERLNLKEYQTFVTSVPLDMSYTWSLPSMVDAETRARLSLVPFSPQWPASLDRRRSITEQVCEREVLLSYPYESMDAFVQLLREAAVDPTVTSIKITLYRLAKQSHLAEALIAAAEHGKEVTAVFELRARFDEANNIEWSQRFEEAGCNVLYGFRDYKVHSKVCCITRQTPQGVQHITQLGTGNYNEKTAKLYTDFSFITTDPRIGADVAAFFRNLQLENLSDEYHMLWVAPLQIKQNIMAGIDNQIALAQAGRPSGLFFKTNSITDKQIIDKIVEASQAGVPCTLLVRGISCIVPGIPGYTDNVAVVSIVGRLLEHSRIYAFGPFNGDCRVYLSSADLMTRNMDKRVEVAWPVLNPHLRGAIIGYIGTCMADTAKLRDLLPSGQYTDLGYFARANRHNGQIQLFDSQDYFIHEAERRLLEASERLLSTEAGSPNAVRRTAQAELSLDLLGEEASEFEHAVTGAKGHSAVRDVDLEQLLAAAMTNTVPGPYARAERSAGANDGAVEEAAREDMREDAAALGRDDEDLAVMAGGTQGESDEMNDDIYADYADDDGDDDEFAEDDYDYDEDDDYDDEDDDGDEDDYDDDEFADDDEFDGDDDEFADDDDAFDDESEDDDGDAEAIFAEAFVDDESIEWDDEGEGDGEDRIEGAGGFVEASVSGIPHIDGLYELEHNPEGKFTVPSLSGGAVEIDRVGGPVIVEEDASPLTLPQEAIEQGYVLNDEQATSAGAAFGEEWQQAVEAQQPAFQQAVEMQGATMTHPAYSQPQGYPYQQPMAYPQPYPQQAYQGQPQQPYLQPEPAEALPQQQTQPLQDASAPAPTQESVPDVSQNEKKSFFKRLFG